MYKKPLDFIKNIFNNHFEVSVFLSAILIVVLAIFIDWLFFLMACPMCILTRYVFVLVAISGLISMIIKKKFYSYVLIIISSIIGLLVTLRQIYIQNMSPEQIQAEEVLFSLLERKIEIPVESFKGKHLFIATPCYGGQVSEPYLRSLVRLILLMNRLQ